MKILLVLLLTSCASSIDYENPGELVPSEIEFIMPGCEEMRREDPEADC